MKEEIAPADLAWIAELRDKVTVLTEPDRLHRRHRFGTKQLTEPQWERLTALIADHELPCTLQSGAYGFNLVVHGPGEIRGVIPAPIICLEYWQVPGLVRGFRNQPHAARELAKITHSERNRELLAWYGFRELDEPERYCY